MNWLDRKPEELSVDGSAMEAAWSEVVRRRARKGRATGTLCLVALVASVASGVALPRGDRPPAEVSVAAPRVEIKTDGDGEGEGELVGPVVDDESGEPTDGRRAGGRTAGPLTGPAQSDSPSGPTQEAGRPRKAEMERERVRTVTVGCIDICVSVAAVLDGQGWIFESHICVQVGTRTHRFSYSTEQEVDFAVRPEQDGDPHWRWAAGQRFAAAEHHIDIPAGDCMVWSTRWSGTDENGQPLASGRYTLSTENLAEQVAGRSGATTTFQID